MHANSTGQASSSAESEMTLPNCAQASVLFTRSTAGAFLQALRSACTQTAPKVRHSMIRHSPSCAGFA